MEPVNAAAGKISFPRPKWVRFFAIMATLALGFALWTFAASERISTDQAAMERDIAAGDGATQNVWIGPATVTYASAESGEITVRGPTGDVDAFRVGAHAHDGAIRSGDQVTAVVWRGKLVEVRGDQFSVATDQQPALQDPLEGYWYVPATLGVVLAGLAFWRSRT